jgi:glycosyltransferase involved in cell wall biosynthesis
MPKKNKKIVIVTHVYTDGPGQAFKSYLIEKRADFLWIGHPLFYNKELKSSGYEMFLGGKLVEEKYKKIKKIPSIFSYIKDIVLTIIYTCKFSKKHKFTSFIGYNNLNAFAGVVLKKLKKVEKVVYAVIDYTPKRFNNKFLNRIYHWLDHFCIRYADETWNLHEKAMNQARKKFWNFNSYKYSKQKNVPMGFWGKRIQKKQNFNTSSLVFMGHIIKQQGVQYVIKAVPKIIEIIPDFKFNIIGAGPYLNTLKNLTNELGLQKNVIFKGFVKDHKNVEEIISSSALAIALYEKGNPETNFTYYTDPGKIKAYLGSGLPILLSDVPPIARELEKYKCGKIIKHDPDSIADAVITFLKNSEILNQYRKNVKNYASRFDWDVIFKKAYNSLV